MCSNIALPSKANMSYCKTDMFFDSFKCHFTVPGYSHFDKYKN